MTKKIQQNNQSMCLRIKIIMNNHVMENELLLDSFRILYTY